jgi:cyanophycinase
VIVGGGTLGPEIVQRFLALAGGAESPIVVIPTATDGEPTGKEGEFLTKAGAKHVVMLHTRDRKVADTKAFTAPLSTARGVWFSGGRQWRLADSYLHTRTEKELFGVLKRGGVIGGSSAGATILGSYLVRGARSGNTIMMAPGYERGLGFLRGVAIDQHLLVRHRENDMLQVIDAHPKLLGIGLDEGTAIVVQGDHAEVVGRSKMAVYDPKHAAGADGRRYYFLDAGTKFNLLTRAVE